MSDEKKTTRHKRNHGEWCFYEYKPKKWVARKQFGRKENGKPNIKALYGNSASEVKKKAKDYDFMLRANGNVESTKMVFDEYYKNWMATYKLHQLKPTSYDALEECLECRIKPYPILAKAQMFNVTTLLLQKYINELVSSQKYSDVREEVEAKWSKTDKQNKAFAISVVGYDPFENCGMTENDRKYAFNILAGYCDVDGIQEDGHKIQSVLQIAQSQLQCRKLDELINSELLSNAPDDNRIKSLAATKKDLQNGILKIAQDNNIASKYNSNSSQGKNTLSQKMKDLAADGYEPIQVNLFDIKTSAAMRQIADLSHQSILEQIPPDANDYSIESVTGACAGASKNLWTLYNYDMDNIVDT